MVKKGNWLCNMYSLEDVVQFFKENYGYDRLFKKMKLKMKSFERNNPGTVIIEKPTEAEKQALSGFMKKSYSNNKSISISLKAFQNRLDTTKFYGFSLKEILEEYFKESIISKGQENRIYEKELTAFFTEILQKQKNTYIYNYLKEILEEQNNIYIWLKLEYNKNKNNIRVALLNVCNTINNLPKEHIRLTILSTQITKNPHSLDKTNLSRKFINNFFGLY